MAASTYLSGNFAPVAEESTVVDLEVVGTIPPELEGRYIRTGPNPLAVPSDKYHWFVGDGMVHGVALSHGRAHWYRNRWVRSPEASAVFGEPPIPIAQGGLFRGNGNTNVLAFGGRILAFEEMSCPYVLDRELRTLEQTEFSGSLPVGTFAHPKIDQATGDMHILGYAWTDSLLRYNVIDRLGVIVHQSMIEMGASVMVHDMGMTERYILAMDLPVIFDIDLVSKGNALPYRWDDSYNARVGLIPRADAHDGVRSDVIWIDVDPCYVFHPVNAYDDGDLVVFDVVRYATMFKHDPDGPNDGPSRLERWVFNPASRSCVVTVLDDTSQEFPRINERLTAQPYRFAWAPMATIDVLGTSDASKSNALFKHDLIAGTRTELALGAGRVAGEVVFIPAADGASEDAGGRMGYVADLSAGAAELLIVDAQTMAEEARVKIPRRIPAGFHGNWVPESALGGI